MLNGVLSIFASYLGRMWKSEANESLNRNGVGRDQMVEKRGDHSLDVCRCNSGITAKERQRELRCKSIGKRKLHRPAAGKEPTEMKESAKMENQRTSIKKKRRQEKL